MSSNENEIAQRNVDTLIALRPELVEYRDELLFCVLHAVLFAAGTKPQPQTQPQPVVLPEPADEPTALTEELDRQLRKEIKTLATSTPDGFILPSAYRWNNNRQHHLPKMERVLEMYGCSNARDLANKLGYLMPAQGRPANTNK